MRKWILDSIEAIGHLIALCSHLREIINTKKLDEESYEQYQDLYNIVISERRQLMKIVEDAIKKVDDPLRCHLKHVIAYYTFAGELEDADKKFSDISLKSEMILNMFLSLYSGQELELCSRCLGDKILDTNEQM